MSGADLQVPAANGTKQSRPITTLKEPVPPKHRPSQSDPSTLDRRPRSAEPHEHQPAPLLHGLGAAPGQASGAARVLDTPAEGTRLGDAELLVRVGIDAISVSVDAVARTRSSVAAAEQRVLLDAAAHRPPTR